MEEPTREDEDASARPESGDSHGDLITRFLLSGNDGEQSPMHSPLHSDDEPRRKRSPSAGSDAPKPKKMPRAKVRPPASVHGLPEAAASSPVLMPLVPKARCVAPPARIFQQAMVAQAPPRVPRQPKPPSGQPLEDAKIYEAKWAAQQSEVECFYNQFAAWTATSAQAQEILARHCARLGPVAAASLEEAVAAAAAMNSHCDKAQVWYFLQSEEERGSFSAVKTSVVTHYTQRGRTRQTDESVREDLGILECSQQLDHEVFSHAGFYRTWRFRDTRRRRSAQLEKTFHRRELPCLPALCALSSEQGRRIMKEALMAGIAEGSYKLLEQFHTQNEPILWLRHARYDIECVRY